MMAILAKLILQNGLNKGGVKMPKNPYKSAEEMRSKNVHITVTEEEFEKLSEAATKKGMNRAQYCRHKLFYESEG